METYAKTPKGQDEIAHRTHGLGLRARRLLILVDGQRSVEDLRGREASAPTLRPVGAAVAVTPLHLDVETVAKVIVAGSVVGLLTGFFGVGGGFVIVPALVLALRFSMPEPVGTSLLVITINAVIALYSRLDAGSIDWGTVIPFTVAGLGGVVAGGRLAGKVDSRRLQRWFIWLLVAVAIYTATRSILALV